MSGVAHLLRLVAGRDRARGRGDAVARVAGRHRVRLGGPADADRPRRHERRHQQPDRGAAARAAVHGAARGPGQPHRRTGNPLPPGLLAELRAGEDEGQLHTDTIILLHVPAGPNARAVAISIPRDSFVTLADGSGRHKINSAYGRATDDAKAALEAQGVTGPELDRRSRDAGRRALVATVEKFTRLPIDHYAEINLAGFVEMTEAIGGVPVCLKRPEHEVRSGVDLPAGPQTVSGADALAFVRQRHGLEGGDLDRIARQQAFLAGLASRMLSTGTLSDPAAVRRLVDAVTRHVVLDRGWNLDRLDHPVRAHVGRRHPVRHHPDRNPRTRHAGRRDRRAGRPGDVRAFVRDTVAATDTAAAACTQRPTRRHPTPRAPSRRRARLRPPGSPLPESPAWTEPPRRSTPESVAVAFPALDRGGPGADLVRTSGPRAARNCSATATSTAACTAAAET